MPSSAPATVGSSAAALDRLRVAIAAQQAWDLLVDLGWVHLSHAGREQSLVELDNAEAALALIPRGGDAATARRACASCSAMYRGLGSVSEPAGERVEHSSPLPTGGPRIRTCPMRNLLLAFDAAALSGDPALIARCQSAAPPHGTGDRRTTDVAAYR